MLRRVIREAIGAVLVGAVGVLVLQVVWWAAVARAIPPTECLPVFGGSCVKVRLQYGAHPDAQCAVGEVFLDTDQTDDTNCATTADNSLCLCVAPNTWVALENN